MTTSPIPIELAPVVERATRILGRPLTAADATPEPDLRAAEARLGLRLPTILRAYHAHLGRCAALSTLHNHILPVEALERDGDHLIFLHENQEVVSWGLRLDALHAPDPEVWQRNNTPPVEWFSEEQPLSAFLRAMLEWYEEADL